MFLFSLAAVILYCFGSLFQWMRIMQYRIPRPVILWLTGAGALCHAINLVLSIYKPAGLVLNFFTVGSLCGWAVVIVVFLSSFKKPLDNIFVILFPGVILTLICKWLIEVPEDILPHLSAGIVFHIIVSILAYSMLTVASLQACLLSYQEHKLKNHTPGWSLWTFPPMETMEKLLFEFISAGMILLTLSLISGFAFFSDILTHYLSHEILLSLISWVVFGILLLGRYTQGWRGQQAIRWTLTGFSLLMLSYFGSKLLMDMVWY